MFKFKGKRSDDMHLTIENKLNFTSSERDIDFITIPGRNGMLAIDNKRYTQVQRSIPCILNLPSGMNVEHVATNINNWLNVDHQFHDFEWIGDPDFVYKAMFHQRFTLNRMIENYGRVVLNFTMHPIKYLKTGLVERTISSGTNIYNPLSLPSKPIIKIVGQGDINLRINDQEIILRRVEMGGVLIDSENQTITTLDGNRSQVQSLHSYPFPVLEVGANVIEFEVDLEHQFSHNIESRIDSVSIIPRFGELI